MSIMQSRSELSAPRDATPAEALVNEIGHVITGVGLELHDCADNVQEVAKATANQSEQFKLLRESADTMIAMNRDIAEQSSTAQETSQRAFREVETSSLKRMPALSSNSSDGSRKRPLHKATTSTASPPCPTDAAAALLRSPAGHPLQQLPHRERPDSEWQSARVCRG